MTEPNEGRADEVVEGIEDRRDDATEDTTEDTSTDDSAEVVEGDGDEGEVEGDEGDLDDGPTSEA